MNNHKDFYISKLHEQYRDSFAKEPMRKNSPFFNYDFRLETRYAIEQPFTATKYLSILNLIFKF